ncbi:MAG: ABC transporter ATP-binding protein [Dehalococcoidia bacterium]|nr:ABC transporter ATP-binding protein [Dehalococcoidia bacterium]
MPNVTFKDVTKRFPETLALDRVSFEVQDGELLGLLRPSGCGKTITLRIIAGLEEADAGEVCIGGSVVNAPAQRAFLPTEKRGIGMVFQSYAIWPHMSVFENVAFPLRVRGIERKAAAGKVQRALTLAPTPWPWSSLSRATSAVPMAYLPRTRSSVTNRASREMATSRSTKSCFSTPFPAFSRMAVAAVKLEPEVHGSRNTSFPFHLGLSRSWSVLTSPGATRSEL